MEQQPLVSILIPTHNRPDFFKQALISALQQTYQNLEIIVSDDSTDDRTEQLVKEEVHDPRVHYFHHAGFKMPMNITWLLSHFHGQYFNMLMDDDLIEPTKIETMLRFYQQYPSVTLVTSYRQRINENRAILPDIPATVKLADQPTKFKGAVIRQLLLDTSLNRIGEPSTVLMDRKYLSKLLSIWSVYHANADIVSWLYLCEQGDVIYLLETLNYFRFHSGQDQQNFHILFEGTCEWCMIYLHEIEKETDVKRRNNYWKRFFDFNHNLLTYVWPKARATIGAEGDNFATQEKLLELDGRYAKVVREYEKVVFDRKAGYVLESLN